MKKISLIIIIIMIFGLTACSSEEEPDYNMINFDDISFQSSEISEENLSEEIKALDNELVSIEGYMSPASPFGDDYFYLIEVPSEVCPFCAGEEVDYDNVIMVYFPEDRPFNFTNIKIKVTGDFEVGFKTDDAGHTGFYRIYAEEMKRLED